MSYWDGNGKYKEKMDKLALCIPDFGFTGDKYFDALISMINLYYDVNNNGWCNAKQESSVVEDFYRYARQFCKDIDIYDIRDVYHNEQLLEDITNRVIENVADYISIDRLKNPKSALTFYYEFGKANIAKFGITLEHIENAEWLNREEVYKRFNVPCDYFKIYQTDDNHVIVRYNGNHYMVISK